ncbi:amidohydrolase family protein [Christiangramia forsetii]|uniref:Secreted amidohydrolase n=2 Tax=Christiangramia forsetii TaxID=411153 RepID=A0M5Q3_CHRFK|nr:amidohydrolase family protein [Christiangramia forsetii]GGG32442.1 amidohydrolase [Christiangramia forsetii]CAL67948.1 secreted amidohydrolase [Christiangramia forsetii KT0803]
MESKALLIYLFFSVFFISISNAQSEMSTIALKGATIFDGNGKSIENGTIVIENNKISSVGANEMRIPENAQIIDVSGKYIMPGLIDAHMHFFQTGFFDSRPDAADLRDTIPLENVIEYQKNHPERYYQTYLRSGITGVYDVGDYIWTLEFQKINDDNPLAPHTASAGPLITPAPEELIGIFNVNGKNTFVHLGSEEQGRNAVIENSNAGTTGVKIWGFKPDDPEFLHKIKGVAEEIKNQNNKMIAHATNLKEAKMAMELGAKLLVHSVSDTLIDEEFLRLMKTNKTLYNPTIVVGRGYYNTYKALFEQNFEISDLNAVVDSKTRSMLQNASAFRKFLNDERAEALKSRLPMMDKRLKKEKQNMIANLKMVYDAGGTIVVGTDAGNPGTLHGISYYDEIEAMQQAGISAKDLIIMATKNGAMAMDRLEDFGTLESGKIADLIILEEDPSEDISNLRSISHVMRNGTLRNVKDAEDFKD